MHDISKIEHRAALKLGLRILGKWGCSLRQMQIILGVDEDLILKKEMDLCSLSKNQLCRISYVANIHAALRVIFNNKSNIYGFMSMPNNNEYFAGRTPLTVIESGDINDLKATLEQLNLIITPKIGKL